MSIPEIIIESTCPYCEYVADRASHLTDKVLTVNPGDYSFCIKCGNVSSWNKEMKLEKIDLNDLPFDDQKQLEKIKIAWLQLDPN